MLYGLTPGGVNRNAIFYKGGASSLKKNFWMCLFCGTVGFKSLFCHALCWAAAL